MERVWSLAEVPSNGAVTVRRILFDCLRRRCGELGLHEGDRLHLGERDGESLIVRRGDGGSVRCPTEVARFVEVDAAV